MKLNIILTCLLILTVTAPIFAHGVHVSTESDTGVVVIADESTGILAKKVVDDLGINATVYKFTSSSQVQHELEHWVNDPERKILAVAYHETVKEFLANNPQTSNQIRVSAAREEDIKNNLMNLTGKNTSNGAETTTSGFLLPFLMGILVGFIAGMGLGAFLMKRKYS